MILLPIPEISQWGPTANYRRTDCGVSCVAMLLSFYGLLSNLTVDNLTHETALVSSDVGLTSYQLVSLAAKHGLSLAVHKNTSLQDITDQLYLGKPVISLIAYRDISGKLDKNDNNPNNDGHFFVVAGINDNQFIVDDPDYWQPHTEEGHNASVPASELDASLTHSGHSRQCIFVLGTPTMDFIPFIKSLDADVKAMQAKITAALGAAAPPPVTTGHPMVVNSDGVNVRTTASIHADIIKVLSKGTEVSVTDDGTADGYTWGKLADGGFIALKYLSPKV